MFPSLIPSHADSGDAKLRSKRDRVGLLARVALLIWMPTVALGVGSLMVGHWTPLPTPSVADGSRLSAGLAKLVASDVEAMGDHAAELDGWKLVHVLYEDCGCSDRVADHLLSPGRNSSAEEWVLLVGAASPRNLPSRLDADLSGLGFHTHALTADELHAQFDVESAPLFVALDPTDRVRYLGGYTTRKQGLGYQDIATLRALRAGASPPPLPVFGCGVSEGLRSTLDPLGLQN